MATKADIIKEVDTHEGEQMHWAPEQRRQKKTDRRGARMLTFLEKVTIDEQRRYRAIIEPCQCGKPMVVEKLPHDFSKCDRTAAPTCSGIICFDEWAARCTSCGFDVCSPCVSYLQAPRGERAARVGEQEIRTASGQVRSGVRRPGYKEYEEEMREGRPEKEIEAERRTSGEEMAAAFAAKFSEVSKTMKQEAQTSSAAAEGTADPTSSLRQKPAAEMEQPLAVALARILL